MAGTYHISLLTDDVHEATAFAKILDSLGIVFQANYRRDQNTRRPESLRLAIYDLASQQRLLDACAEELDETRRTASTRSFERGDRCLRRS